MGSSGLATGRARATSALLVLAVLGVAGCATTAASTVSVAGQTLSVYASGPPSGAGDVRAEDVLEAERLAFAGSRANVGRYKLRFVVVRAAKASDNARTAIQDSSSIAYLGEIAPGQSADSLGIVGDVNLLQVSPTDTAVELTQATSAVAGAPDIYYESLKTTGRTFARVVPSTAAEARALIAEARREGVTKLFVATDGSSYGVALAAAVRQAAGTGLTVSVGAPTPNAVSGAGADGVLYAGAAAAGAVSLFNAAIAGHATLKLFAPSALDEPGFAGALSPAAQRALSVSAPGFTPAALTPAGRQFTQAFATAYGHQPAPEAIFGYEAMSALLAVLREAGANAGSRTTVRNDFFAIRQRPSVLGTYSIDSNGDTNLAPFVINRVKGGRLTPARFVSGQA